MRQSSSKCQLFLGEWGFMRLWSLYQNIRTCEEDEEHTKPHRCLCVSDKQLSPLQVLSYEKEVGMKSV